MNAAATLLVAAAQTFACPMCKSSIANADNADEMSATVNTAILILLAPTLAMIGGLIKMVFKYRHFHNDERYRARERAAPLAHARGTVPVINYVYFTTSGSERDSQQRQRDSAGHGISLHSSEKNQGPPGFDD